MKIDGQTSGQGRHDEGLARVCSLPKHEGIEGFWYVGMGYMHVAVGNRCCGGFVEYMMMCRVLRCGEKVMI